MIRETFGPLWAWVSAIGLAVATAGALLTEFSGVAGVGELYGISRAITLPIAAALLLAIVLTGSYRRVERAAILIGLFEFAFFFVAYAAHPDPAVVARQAIDLKLGDASYLYLVAANIGAVIMPWMIFYQQSAIADKRLTAEDFSAARFDTALGALVTQLVMAAVLVGAAATIGVNDPKASLTTVGEMSQSLIPFLGPEMGRAVSAPACSAPAWLPRLSHRSRLPGDWARSPAIGARWNTDRWKRAGSTRSMPSVWPAAPCW